MVPLLLQFLTSNTATDKEMEVKGRGLELKVLGVTKDELGNEVTRISYEPNEYLPRERERWEISNAVGERIIEEKRRADLEKMLIEHLFKRFPKGIPKQEMYALYDIMGYKGDKKLPEWYSEDTGILEE